MYDIIVIGKGLMGAAAIRHLSAAHPDLSVAAIGPDEPADYKTHDGVFSSHYDQGRITRILDSSPVWATLAARSIERYSQIEADSGIRFHDPVGCLRLTDEAPFAALVEGVRERFCPETERLSPEACYERYPYLSFSQDFFAWDEQAPAGYINPRSLIAAQITVAEKNGAAIIRETVSGFSEKSDYIEISTREGNSYQTKKILITTGGFTNLILDQPVSLTMRATTILRAELPQSEIERLAGMPSLITRFQDRDVPSMYMLPPVVYPDGKTYIKLGPSFRPDELPLPEQFIETADELREWFQSDGRDDIAEALKNALHRLIPNLKPLAYKQSPCIITRTPHEMPYIDALVPGKIYITTGGNGSSAKSSDEIGRIGAMLAATDTWTSELRRADFRVVWG